MTVATMTHVTTDFGKAIWTSLRAFGNGVWEFFVSLGYARAAAELHRQGFYQEAKDLMLMDRSK
jgi:hypothetical protein